MGYKIFNAGIRQLFSPSGDVGKYHLRVMRKIQNEIQARTPVDTGKMRGGWQSERRVRRGSIIEGEIYNTTEYLPPHVYGSGIYGPKARPIEPLTAPYLVWRGKQGQLIFAKQVKGIPKNDFIREGMEAGSPWPVEYYVD